jgi:hypothetical protein
MIGFNKTSLIVMYFLFLVFLPVKSCLFCNAGLKTRQKSLIEQNISVILSFEITRRIDLVN